MSASTTFPRQLICSSCSRIIQKQTSRHTTPAFLLPTKKPIHQPQQNRHHTTFTIRPSPQTSPTRLPLPPPSQTRTLTTTHLNLAVSKPRPRNSKTNLRTKDRGPPSKESTQTDFAALNVLGGTANPSTSVDICTTDGFMLDSGLQIVDGNGVVLTASEAFVWRPWMAGKAFEGGRVVNGEDLRRGRTEGERTGGVVNAKGQWEIAEEAWGVFRALWPKPGTFVATCPASMIPVARGLC